MLLRECLPLRLAASSGVDTAVRWGRRQQAQIAAHRAAAKPLFYAAPSPRAQDHLPAKVLPGLFVGSQHAAYNVEALRRL